MKRLIPVLISILFASCDPLVVNQYAIENRTESNVKIESILERGKRKSTETDAIKKVEIAPQTASIITEYTEIGNPHDKGIDFLNGIDTIIIKKANGTLTKNIFDRKNWTYKTLKEGLFSMGEVEYKLILTENDFE